MFGNQLKGAPSDEQHNTICWMDIEIGKAVGFEVPLPYVNQCVSGKNEATLEFHLVNNFYQNILHYNFIFCLSFNFRDCANCN